MHYVFLTFSMLTPLILALFFVLGMQINLSSHRKFCLEKTHKLQAKHRSLTTKLLSLNPKASKLRTLRRSAEVAYKTAPVYAKPAALTALQIVKASQKTFHSFQKSLIFQAKALAYQFQINMYQQKYHLHQSSKKLHVYASPKNSASPSYYLEPNYTRKKAVRLSKQINLHRLIPSTILQYFSKNPAPKIFSFHCGASISQKGGRPSDIKVILGKYL